MKEELFVNESIEVAAPAAAVWRVLTEPALTKQYMFGCETVSDWKVGSPLLWKGQWEGKEMVFVKGTVVAFEPPHLLRYTVFDPNGGIEDIPANYLEVTCRLSARGDKTLLEISQGNFATVANGQKRYEDSIKSGGNALLAQMKSLAERIARG